jgi:hypothetical protein
MDEHDGLWRAAGPPEGLPVLGVGSHRDPEHGACVMEYVSVLAGERWSDAPACTDRTLGQLARRVNDDVGWDARTALAAVAPRLVGAGGPHAATDVVIAAVARVGLESAPEKSALIRIQRRVRARIAAAPGPGSRARPRSGRLGRALTGTGLATTYLHLGRAVSGRPPAERDAARVRALAQAVEDVRRHLEASTAGSAPVIRGAPAPADVRR